MDAAATRLHDPVASLRPEESRLVSQVIAHGWRTTGVAAPAGYAAYSYTTGFCLSYDAPELITFDLTEGVRHDLFGEAARRWSEGKAFPANQPVDGFIEGERVCFIAVGRAQADAYLPGTRWFYRDSAFPCWQMVWSDAAGRFPWDDAFDPDLAGIQPDLSEGSDWGGLRK